jgi:hypothetical protein
MMVKKNSMTMRIDAELNQMLKELAEKNNISMREASKKLAKMCKLKINKKKINIPDEVIF